MAHWQKSSDTICQDFSLVLSMPFPFIADAMIVCSFRPGERHTHLTLLLALPAQSYERVKAEMAVLIVVYLSKILR